MISHDFMPAAGGQLKEEKQETKVPEYCAVCGDASTGFHYEVSSCNGCKTFFRRTVISKRTYECHREGRCVFDKDVRCACRACRFAKCLQVGMNPNAIQCNRTRQSASPEVNPPSPPLDGLSSPHSMNASKLSVASSSSVDGVAAENIQPTNNVLAEITIKSECNERKRPYTVSALLDLPQFSPFSSNGGDSVERQTSMSVSPPSLIMSDMDGGLCKRNRSDTSEKFVNQILNTQDRVEQLYLMNYEPRDSVLDMLTSPCALENLSDYMGRREPKTPSNSGELNLNLALGIEYAKSFEVFQKMPLNDKLFLLRDVTIVISLFEIAYRRFVQKRIAMQSAHTSLKSNVSDLNDDNGSLMQLAVDSLSRVELDRSEFSMLKAVVFLHAECFGLSKTSYQQLIKWRQTVLDSLFEYMSSKHGRQGPVRYGNLLSISWTLFRLAQDMKDKLLQKDDLQQLSEEIISSQLPQRLVRC